MLLRQQTRHSDPPYSQSAEHGPLLTMVGCRFPKVRNALNDCPRRYLCIIIGG